MSWTQGDWITADKLNTENQGFRGHITTGDHGYSDWSGTYFFYCTKRTGTLITIQAQFGWNSHGWAELYKWENNSWVVKKNGWGGTSGLWSWSWDKGDCDTFGEGYYKLYLSFGHFSTLNVYVYNASISCEVGSYLAKINNMGLLTNDSSPYKVTGEYITTDDLNSGRIYTL